MDKVFEKISSYNIFNYIVPGAVFMYLLSIIIGYKFEYDNVIYSFCVCYFFGLLVSRVGSLFLEPVYKFTSFVKYVDYVDYSKAYSKSPVIDLMNEVNNMYRTFASVFFILCIVFVFYNIFILHGVSCWSVFLDWRFFSLLAIFVLMSFSYRKQTSYIRKKVSFLNSEG